MTSRAWATLACVVLAAACPAAIAMQGQPLWVVVLSALGAGAGAGVGWLGLRRPGDTAPPEPERPLYQRHLPLALLCALPLSACAGAQVRAERIDKARTFLVRGKEVSCDHVPGALVLLGLSAELCRDEGCLDGISRTIDIIEQGSKLACGVEE